MLSGEDHEKSTSLCLLNGDHQGLKRAPRGETNLEGEKGEMKKNQTPLRGKLTLINTWDDAKTTS